MKIAVFDVDDTLIIHGESSQSYYAQVLTHIYEI